MNERVVIWGCVGGVVILLILVVRLLVIVAHLNSSIAKIGYVIREDAKKYFDDTSHSILETNEKFRESYVDIVKTGTQQALAGASQVMGGALAQAQNQAGTVVLEAREESRRIVEAARTEAGQYKMQALEQASASIQWVLEQYAGQSMTLQNHEDLIKNLLQQYLNETRN